MKLPTFLDPTQLENFPAQWTAKTLFYKLHSSQASLTVFSGLIQVFRAMVWWFHFPPSCSVFRSIHEYLRRLCSSAVPQRGRECLCGPISDKPEHWLGTTQMSILKARPLLPDGLSQWKEHPIWLNTYNHRLNVVSFTSPLGDIFRVLKLTAPKYLHL